MKNIHLLLTALALFICSTGFSQRPYITVWKTDNAGVSASNQITLPAIGSFSYTWEQENNAAVNGSGSGSGVTTITFPTAGNYRLSISATGMFSHQFGAAFSANNDSKKLLRLEQWGDIVWSSMNRAFQACSTLTVTATDIPNLTNVTDMSCMFCECKALANVPNIKKWDVSNVTNMRLTFSGASLFNEDIGNWNVSNVTDMYNMLSETDIFNQDISRWDVSKVTDMGQMFVRAYAFNQPIGNWNTSNAKSMNAMFSGATSFNKPIGNWNTSNVMDMTGMFDGATSFNQPIGSWNTAKVISMEYMFMGAKSFNQNIGNWITSNVTKMDYMFENATLFNQSIGAWDVSKVNDMYRMFFGATSFNQPIGNWNVTNVTNMGSMFYGASSFNQPIGNWNTANVTNMNSMFRDAVNFNQQISNWNTAKVKDRSIMFYNARAFNQDLGKWDLSATTTGQWMFGVSGMDCNNYGKTLIGWASKSNTPNNVNFLSQSGRVYGTVGQTARNTLISKGWTVSGDSYNASCILVGDPTIEPWGSNHVTGNTITNVWLAGSQPPLYVRRYYEITPETNANTATARVTLSFSNQDFKDFNSQNPAPALLLPDTDDPATITARKANLLIEKRGGISSDGSGLPNTYSGTIVTINPADEDIVWDSGEQNWRVSFDVIGFSGFWVKTLEAALPVNFGNITAVFKNGRILIKWTTLTETNNSYFDVEISKDGKTFTKLSSIKSKANNGNSSSPIQYEYAVNVQDMGLMLGLSLFILGAGLFAFSAKRKNIYIPFLICGISIFSFSACHKNKDADIDLKEKYTKHWIRIKQLDIDGNFKYSKTVQVVVE